MILKKYLSKISIVGAILLFLSVFCLNPLALSKSHNTSSNKAPIQALTKLATASITNSPVSFDDDEINSLILYAIECNKDNISLNNVNLKNTCLKLNDDNTVTLNMPLSFNKINLNLEAKLKVNLIEDENIITFDIYDTKVGHLPIPKSIIINKIANISPYISKTKDGKLYVPSTINFCLNNNQLQLKINSLNIKNNNLTLTISGGINAIKDYINNLM